MAKKATLADFIPSFQKDPDTMGKPGVSSAEHKEVEKPDTPVPGDTSETGTSSGTGGHKKVEDFETFYKPRTSWRARDNLEIQNIPVGNDETGQISKVYEILMKRFGVEIPELRNENLSDIEKTSRENKTHNVIFFEEVKGEEEEKLALSRPVRVVLGMAYQLCHRMTQKQTPIRVAKMVSSHVPGIVMIRVKFMSLEDKKLVLAKKETLIGTKYSIDHDLTKTEIHVQSQLMKLWRKKGYRKDYMVNKKIRIHVDNKWVTLYPVSSQFTSKSTQ